MSSDATQTDPAILEMAEVETIDFLPEGEDQEVISKESYIQPEKSHRTRASPPSENVNASIQTDVQEQPSVSETIVVNEEPVDITQYRSEHQESRKRDQENETVIIEREYVYETDFEYPDIERSNAEMDALKAEHEKMMQTIRKASEDRKSRAEKLRAKKLDHLGNVVYDVESRNRYIVYDDRVEGDQQQKTSMQTTISREETETLSKSKSPENNDFRREVKPEANKYKEESIIRGYKRSDTSAPESMQKLDKFGKAPDADEEDDGTRYKRYEIIYVDTVIHSDSDEERKNDETEEVGDSNAGANRTDDKGNDLADDAIVHEVFIPKFSDHVEQSRNHVDEMMRKLPKPIEESVSRKNMKDSMRTPSHNSVDSLASDSTLIAEEMSSMLKADKNDVLNADGVNRYLDRNGATNRSIPERKDLVEDVLSDSEILHTPPNSPTPDAMGKGDERTARRPLNTQLKELEDKITRPDFRRGMLKRSVSETTKRPSGLRGNTVSTGVEAAVDISDDFTQTDLLLDLSKLENGHSDRNGGPNVPVVENHRIKSELDRLQKERVEIIDLLSLNFLPASLNCGIIGS